MLFKYFFFGGGRGNSMIIVLNSVYFKFTKVRGKLFSTIFCQPVLIIWAYANIKLVSLNSMKFHISIVWSEKHINVKLMSHPIYLLTSSHELTSFTIFSITLWYHTYGLWLFKAFCEFFHNFCIAYCLIYSLNEFLWLRIWVTYYWWNKLCYFQIKPSDFWQKSDTIVLFNLYPCSPRLNWRDLQHIIVLTSSRKHLKANDWRQNGADFEGKCNHMDRLITDCLLL